MGDQIDTGETVHKPEHDKLEEPKNEGGRVGRDTFRDFREAAEKYRNVDHAMDNAVTAFVNYFDAIKRYNAKPGFWAKLRVDRREVDGDHFLGVFLKTYSMCTGEVVDQTLIDRCGAFIGGHAQRVFDPKEADRQFMGDMIKALGHGKECAEGGEPSSEGDTLPDRGEGPGVAPWESPLARSKPARS